MGRRGRYIVFEGIDGCGKSTQMELVSAELERRGYFMRRGREPGGSEMAEEIRKTLLRPRAEVVDPITSLLLFNAARRQFLRTHLAGALEDCDIFLSDRSFLSTLAYQGYAEGLDLDLVRTVCEATMEGMMPDLIVVIDLPVAVACARLIKRVVAESEGGAKGTRYDQKSSEFFECVRRGYLEEAQRYPFVRIVDGDRYPDAIVSDILSLISGALSLNIPPIPGDI